MSIDTRPFPIQAEHGTVDGRHVNYPASTVPWWLAEIAYQEYARRYGYEQSLERLAERGGFGRFELLRLLRREDR